ncbi:4Fe-4S ferredoxin iron-sulfur binding domain protein [Gloeothece citriformis PCC 7424]|uniref:4Fe-4S ferredoxin iron-sulfur binding domain protein n=1 Tax=Gloeothece citriformis (strain PCC 7424) TaxID=65393 RepID=B7KG79_GLOC7|nr:4Fe-4S binding protein [Gloeothece citriformis]ACK70550.1 4Fe-4S ferredoxin iron-sulfur binding domain protein [Gloeothece citriformis PCC 7424]
MSYTITHQCIGCDRCLVQCPTGAIEKVNDVLVIDSTLCNDCLGYYGTAQCASICPTNGGCVKSDSLREELNPIEASTTGNLPNYWDSWFIRYNYLVNRLKTNQRTQYWQDWFDTYSSKLTSLLSQPMI